MFRRCELYVLRSFSIDWLSPISINISLNTGSSEDSAVVISMPHCIIYWSSPTVLRQTDFPPALGPEIRRILLSGFSCKSSGTIFFPSLFRFSSSNGWRALWRRTSPDTEMTGLPAAKRDATIAFADIKSSSPIYSAEAIISGRYGLRNSVNSVRILTISLCSAKWSSRT